MKAGMQVPAQQLQQWREWLEDIHGWLECGDPNFGRAYRLLDDWDWPEDED